MIWQMLNRTNQSRPQLEPQASPEKLKISTSQGRLVCGVAVIIGRDQFFFFLTTRI